MAVLALVSFTRSVVAFNPEIDSSLVIAHGFDFNGATALGKYFEEFQDDPTTLVAVPELVGVSAGFESHSRPRAVLLVEAESSLARFCLDKGFLTRMGTDG